MFFPLCELNRMTDVADPVLNKIRRLNTDHELASSFHYDFESRAVRLSLEQYITDDERYAPADIVFEGVSSFESNDVDPGENIVQELAAIDCRKSGDRYTAILTLSVGRESKPWVVSIRFTGLKFQRG